MAEPGTRNPNPEPRTATPNPEPRTPNLEPGTRNSGTRNPEPGTWNLIYVPNRFLSDKIRLYSAVRFQTRFDISVSCTAFRP